MAGDDSPLPSPRLHPPPLARSIVEAIGNTPLVELSRLPVALPELLFVTPSGARIPPTRFRLLAKLEYLQPGGSKKDRVALHLLLTSRRSGALKPGQPVIELTSGNTGTGLAIACPALGHPFTAVMSEGNSAERARMMRALGAEVVLVPQAPGGVKGKVSGRDLELVEARARELVAERGAFRADQFSLPGSSEAHYVGTGPEILEQAGSVDVFADFVGTGGSFAGAARCFKERDPLCFCAVAEPEHSRVLAGMPTSGDGGHKVQGGGYSFPDLKLLDKSLADAFVGVSDDEAVACARALATEEGIFAGFSAGANLAAAAKALGLWWEREERAGRLDGGKVPTVVFLACDTGLKYVSTDLWPN
ncbi:cysteine synthase [Hyaloraphidium curvatum]|nr:cysteine synthase [Hyaloraphidium curvatum]